MDDSKFILTIGYGNRTIDDFIDLLLKYQVKYLVDVRSSPYSKYKPEFNKENLELILKSKQLLYVYMGDTIGGLPSDRSCYSDDHVDYDKVKQKDFYKNGIQRLEKAYEGSHSVVIMCSESKPEMCHRSKLIGVTLENQGILVKHIDECGLLVTQYETIKKVIGEQLDLFNNTADNLRSRGKY